VSGSHVDDELLAAAAGSADLTDSQASRLTVHLADCPSCQTRRDQLVTVRRALAALPAAPMPPEVLDALSARLAAEPWPQATGATTGGARAPTPPGRAHRTRGKRPPLLPLSIAAGLALIAGITAVALNGRSPDSTGGAASTAGAAREVSSARAARSSAAPLSGAAGSTGRAQGPAPTRPEQQAASPAAGMPLLVTTGRNYHHATLSAGASDLALRSAATRFAAASPHAGTGSPARPNAPSPACLLGLGVTLGSTSGPALQVVAVDAARYDGRPALVMVIIDPQDSSHELAIAVAGSCTEGPAPLLDQVAVPS